MFIARDCFPPAVPAALRHASAFPSLRAVLSVLCTMVLLLSAPLATPVHALGVATQRDARADLPARPLVGELVSVSDGDSFVLRAADGRIWQVRIAAIDAPERTQPWSDVARRQLRGRLQGREIRVEAVKFDPFGRIVGSVHVVDEDVGLGQVSDGMAWHFRRYAHEQQPAERASYQAAEAAARAARRGLWRDPAPVEPWHFRSNRRAEERARSHANAPR